MIRYIIKMESLQSKAVKTLAKGIPNVNTVGAPIPQHLWTEALESYNTNEVSLIIYSYYGDIDTVKDVLVSAMDDPDNVIAEIDSMQGEVFSNMAHDIHSKYMERGFDNIPSLVWDSDDVISIPELEFFITGLYVGQDGKITDVISRLVKVEPQLRSYLMKLHEEKPDHSFIVTHTKRMLRTGSMSQLISDMASPTIESTYTTPDRSFTATVVDMI